jgi:glycosyltransferase involved in cell wall biosynthesis
MRILLVAYSCHPAAGSEPGIGWGFAKSLSERHDVWLLTRGVERPAIERALDDDPRPNLRPIYLDPPAALGSTKAGGPQLVIDYIAWQVVAARVGRKLQRDVHFDVGHHVTFSLDWLPSALVAVPDLPLVWGPVGGYNESIWSMTRWLGWRGIRQELVRFAASGVLRYASVGVMAHAASLVVAGNDEAARYYRRRAKNVVVEPYVVAERAPAGTFSGEPSDAVPTAAKTAMFVGRLLAWKGLGLAVAALAQPVASEWRLNVFGDGPDRMRAEALAARLGVCHRVTFLGPVPHDRILQALRRADALLQPSMHDAGGFAVAEAVASGCPVICLDRGGPSIIAVSDVGVRVRPGRRLAERLGEALAGVTTRGTPSTRWSGQRLAALSDGWYELALARRSRSTDGIRPPA